MSIPLYLIGTGTRTPLGLHSASAAAAVRAAISSCADHPYMIDQAGEPMAASMDVLLEPDLSCRQRMLVMAQAALQEACSSLTESIGIKELPLFLGLPESRPGFDEDDAKWIVHQLVENTELPIAITQFKGFMMGHSAGLSILDRVRGEMAQGRYPACLIGGVESYFHPDTMEWLDENRQLHGSVSRSGFVPGEGAGFCLVTSSAFARQTGLNSVARITQTATAWETKLIKTQDMNFGEALTQTVRATVSHLDPQQQPVHSIYCDINGERYRGEEWGFTCLKLGHHFRDPTGYWCPADCWGDMGAASGILFLVLATQAALGGYAPGNQSLLWAGSENGLRAATLVEAEVMPSPYRG